jgi:hypothetical protein
MLPNGKVLVAGGTHLATLSSTELYDSANRTWGTNGPMTTARQLHTATLLTNGQVLIAGGGNDVSVLSSAELSDLYSGTEILVAHSKQSSEAFRLAFASKPHETNAAYATTNISLPFTNWPALGVVPEFSPGLYLLTDPEATNSSQRFYRVQFNQ